MKKTPSIGRVKRNADIPSPSFKGLVPVLIEPIGVKPFHIFCKLSEVEEKKAKVLAKYSKKDKFNRGQIIIN